MFAQAKQLLHKSLLSFSLLLLTRCQSFGVSHCCCPVRLHRAVNYRISESIFHRPYYRDKLQMKSRERLCDREMRSTADRENKQNKRRLPFVLEAWVAEIPSHSPNLWQKPDVVNLIDFAQNLTFACRLSRRYDLLFHQTMESYSEVTGLRALNIKILFTCYIDQKLAITQVENLILGANISAILNDPELVILPGWISIKKHTFAGFLVFIRSEILTATGQVATNPSG